MNHESKTRGPRGSRWLLIVTGIALIWAPARGEHYSRGQPIPEVRLKNGTVYHGFTVVAVGSTSVVARWEGGQGSIPLVQLPEEVRADFPPPVVTPKPAAAPVAATPPEEIDPKLATAEIPTEIKLTNGFVMHKSTVKRWTEKSVLIAYQGGIVTILFKNITPEQRGIFLARKDEALAQQAKEDLTNNVGQEANSHEEDERQAKEAQDRAEKEKLAEEIKNGVSFHYLVKGMTKQDVKQAYGRPVNDRGDSFLYVLRGHDKYGNSADRTLTFQDGRLVSWHDEREGDPDGAVDH